VFIASVESRELVVASMGPDGSLVVQQRLRFEHGVRSMTSRSDGRVLYIASRGKPSTVHTLDISSTDIRITAFSTLQEDLVYIALDPQQQYFLSASYHGNSLFTHSILSSGMVRPGPTDVHHDIVKAHCILARPNNDAVYATSLGSDRIYQFRLGGNGELWPLDPAYVAATPDSGPRHLAFHPRLAVLYCVNELNASLGAYVVNEGGLLSALDESSLLPAGFTGRPWAADLRIHPSGRFAYSSERTSGTICRLDLDPDNGSFTGKAIFTTEPLPRSIASDPEGRFLLTAGEKTGSITIHAIEPENGDLKVISRTVVSDSADWIEIIPRSGPESPLR
jgi:6-phosphogluconolactonase